ncbi:MAG: hypothetical protein IJ368_00685 [Oscillospiraceae bacterium]|nr:hypothetical protein [Oscillospiraceae bacterium]
MLISSEKANRSANKAVEFSSRHKWAKIPCLCAVTAIYSTEFVRLKASELFETIRQSAQSPFRPLGSRIFSAVLSAAFTLMVIPFTATDVAAEEYSDVPAAAALPDPTIKLPQKPRVAADEDAIANRITMEGLAEDNSTYKLKLNIRTLKKDITARFTDSPELLGMVRDSFELYGIPTNNLNISPVDITLFTTEEKQKLQLQDGYSADITLPIPEDMNNHHDDLKVVRLEDDGSMTIIEGTISPLGSGNVISFNTDHFSVFALVAYSDEPEDVSSGAGTTGSGMTTDITNHTSGNIFDEDKRRFKRTQKRNKHYRIKRIVKENDLLL